MSNKKWYQKLWQALVENGNAARDARIGAVGADQVRQLYKDGEDEKAKQLAKDYLKANAIGIATGIGGAGTLSSISQIGVVPTIVTEVAGAAGGAVGAKAGEFVGQKVDNKFGTNTTPWLTLVGSLAGGFGGGIAGYKGLVNLGSRGLLKNNTARNLYGSQFVKDALSTALDRQFKQTPSKLNLNYYTDYKFFERPSKLTDAERLGIPKGERNQPLNGHLKGDTAVQMFKEYGVQTPTKDSKIYSDIQKLVPEARERYGLVGNTNITDDEIAGSLYKRAMELNGEGNAAVWETGEPRLLFRGDTRRYNRLLDRSDPEHLHINATEDNSLGNLFLGELPGESEWGIDRYLHRVQWNPYLRGDSLYLSATGDGIKHDGTVLQEIPNELRRAFGQIYGPKTSRSFGRIRLLPANLSPGGGNDINPFVIRAKNIRDATDEISVGVDVGLLESKGIDYSSGTRSAMLKHYRTVLDDAVSKNQGLLISNPNSPFRQEHSLNTYYALPNFNRQNAKHLFGWDLRKPVQWGVDNIYLEKGGKLPKFQPGGELPRLEEFNSSKLGKILDWIDLGADALSMTHIPYVSQAANIAGIITGTPQAVIGINDYIQQAKDGNYKPTLDQIVAVSKIIPTGGMWTKAGMKALLAKDGIVRGVKASKILSKWIPGAINLGTDTYEIVKNQPGGSIPTYLKHFNYGAKN